MQAHPDIFQAMCIGKKTYEAIKHFQINVPLSSVRVMLLF